MKILPSKNGNIVIGSETEFEARTLMNFFRGRKVVSKSHYSHEYGHGAVELESLTVDASKSPLERSDFNFKSQTFNDEKAVNKPKEIPEGIPQANTLPNPNYSEKKKEVDGGKDKTEA